MGVVLVTRVQALRSQLITTPPVAARPANGPEKRRCPHQPALEVVRTFSTGSGRHPAAPLALRAAR